MKLLGEVPQEAEARFLRALDRLLRELVLLHYEQTALKRLDGRYTTGCDFFAIAQRGIFGDRLIRLIRLLEDDQQAASFWYLNRCAPRTVTECLSGISLNEIKDLSDRLTLIRNKVFVHIDKEGLFSAEQIYKEANITGGQIDKVISGLWSSMNELHRRARGDKFKAQPDYDGLDIVALNNVYQGDWRAHLAAGK
jgi:hypothetical protein